MTHATTHNTNTPRRAHPAAVRAALRSSAAAVTSYPPFDLLRAGRPMVGRVSRLNKHWMAVPRNAPQAACFPACAGMTSYNALGQKNSLTYPDGATYRYTYDANNQLSTVNLPTGPNANTASITFNSYQWTVPAQITLPGGTVRTQDYDGLLRVKDISVKDPGQSQVLNYQYGYDTTGNIASKATEAGATSYSYDSLDHLTGATYTNQTTPQANETYTYDPVANRITDHRTTAAWTYNENNQLETADGISYTYDDNGNTLNQTDANGSTGSPQARNYTYDTDNRLIEVRDNSNTLIAAYSYDPFGRRLSKDTGTQKTYYFYNAEGLIAEADASGQVTKSYGYAPGSTASTGSAQAFSTNPLWLKAAAMGSQTQGYYYYQNDHLGTPQKLLNQSGVVVWSATYDSFGKATVDAASTVSNNLRFPGQYEDGETGLHYNWMRYYDPLRGRYVTSDPIRLLGGVNFYIYVGGNPLAGIDPKGLFKVHGNWCGPDWTGGRIKQYDPHHPYLPPDYYAPPIDATDISCKTHDICYYSCRKDHPCSKDARGNCMTACDRKLAASIRFGPKSGTSLTTSAFIYGWMKLNRWPNPDANAVNCIGCNGEKK